MRKETLCVRIDENLYKRVEDEACKSARTMEEMATAILEWHFHLKESYKKGLLPKDIEWMVF